MGDLELRLSRLRIEIKCLVMAFAEPCSSLKVAKDYKDMFDSDINFKQYGYSCLESLLKDHDDLQFINAGGQVLFKAKVTKETESLQKMISAQKKKKKSKKGKPSFQRGARPYRSYAPSSKPASQYSFNRMSFRGTTAMQKNVRAPIRVPHTPSKSDGVLGMSRFMRILKNFDGKVTLRKFREAYHKMYNQHLDKAEMESLFGLNNLVAVHTKYLADMMDIVPLPDGYMLISKDNIKKRKIWEETHTFQIVSNNPIKWDKPSLATLYKNVFHLLKEMYPETIAVVEASEIYKRFYSVQVDPVALYAKSWEQLTTGVFGEKLKLSQNCICLQESVVNAERLRTPQIPSCQQSTCTSVSDIMIDTSDEEDEDDYQAGVESEVESVASYFTTSCKTDERSDGENDEKDGVQGFGFGRVSSLRKSRTIKKNETNKQKEHQVTSVQSNSPTPEIAGLQVSNASEEQPKKGRGFGFKSFAKSLISKISDKEKDKSNVRKVSDSTPRVKPEKEEEANSSDSSSWKGYQVKFVGQKYMNNTSIERALSHTNRNPLNTSAR
ncbi:unnamed protein product [Auanema sp. JU1783]|nr:unnamed protein product [Auanema sp. JU1783]